MPITNHPITIVLTLPQRGDTLAAGRKWVPGGFQVSSDAVAPTDSAETLCCVGML
jgi:hypothetical protein